MSQLPKLINKLLIAAAIGLALAFLISIRLEHSPSAAINRGDFPAFYTLALIANSAESARLYDLELQRAVQNRVWPDLAGTVLPAAYPPYLAMVLRPLAMLDPETARWCWVCMMLGCVILSMVIVSRTTLALQRLSWQLCIAALLFAPLLLGVLGCQTVGWSLLCYSSLLSLSRRRTATQDVAQEFTRETTQNVAREVATGCVVGLWMFKPHFALTALFALLIERRWLACSMWLFCASILWGVGALLLGPHWVDRWLAFAGEFSAIDLATNAYQMTGLVPAVYALAASLTPASGIEPLSQNFWHALSLASFLAGLAVMFRCCRAQRRDHASVRSQESPVSPFPCALIALGPTIVIFVPAVNFYDLSLLIVPLLAISRPHSLGHLIIAALLLISGAIFVTLKDCSVPAIGLLVAVTFSCLCWWEVLQNFQGNKKTSPESLTSTARSG